MRKLKGIDPKKLIPANECNDPDELERRTGLLHHYIITLDAWHPIEVENWSHEANVALAQRTKLHDLQRIKLFVDETFEGHK